MDFSWWGGDMTLLAFWLSRHHHNKLTHYCKSCTNSAVVLYNFVQERIIISNWWFSSLPLHIQLWITLVWVEDPSSVSPTGPHHLQSAGMKSRVNQTVPLTPLKCTEPLSLEIRSSVNSGFPASSSQSPTTGGLLRAASSENKLHWAHLKSLALVSAVCSTAFSRLWVYPKVSRSYDNHSGVSLFKDLYPTMAWFH